MKNETCTFVFLLPPEPVRTGTGGRLKTIILIIYPFNRSVGRVSLYLNILINESTFKSDTECCI